MGCASLSLSPSLSIYSHFTAYFKNEIRYDIHIYIHIYSTLEFIREFGYKLKRWTYISIPH